MEITQRQAQILAAIVKEYSQTGDPVGSEELVHRYHFAVSPATIRNEMKALEKSGFISQPHTSAGRVPSDKGYRYFVNKLMGHLELSIAQQRRLENELLRLKTQYIELGRSISKLLAERAGGAAFALLPESVSTSGLSQVIREDTSKEEIRELARFLDELDVHGKKLIERPARRSFSEGRVQTFIGKESPIPLASDFSLMVTRVKLQSGEKGLIGIVGPKRMKYARNISLLEYISKLLSTGIGIYLIVNHL